MTLRRKNKMNLQDLILTLNGFWAKKNCIIYQPYHTEVGAGTSNPATFLRVLGPEPWWVAYVEPSIRPADGRYGENPNRLQHYYQYQVILKPSPANVQDLFLQSLESLGLDLKVHDFRFVEDNWASPSLGAWGLGWEAWLDGMEVLQFTYFQECGGVKLNVRACELTYGVERIAMYLQDVDSIFDLKWNSAGVTYRDVFFESEVEFCKYNFELADTELLFRMFEMWENDAARLLEMGVVVPAYDHCLRMSHLFNLLDARNAFSAAERGRYLLRCRRVTERCAKGFVEQRAGLRHPMARLWKQFVKDEVLPAEPAAGGGVEKSADLLIEIGAEEIPPCDIAAVREQAAPLISSILDDLRIAHGEIKIYSTPRRIAALVADAAGAQQSFEEEVRGPRVNPKDAGEIPTAARKFAESRGCDPAGLVVKEQKNAEYFFLTVKHAGKTLDELMPEILKRFIGGFRFVKAMGWEDSTVAFSRPVRWLVALHGGRVIPAKWVFTEASEGVSERYITTGRLSYGHRRLAGNPVEIGSAADYLKKLRGADAIADRDERMSMLKDSIEGICKKKGLTVAEDCDDLYDEVCDLVEYPEPILCSIPEKTRSLPDEIIITPMKVHQRYFPLRERDGKLSGNFFAVANGRHSEEAKKVIRGGNEKVLNARLRDALYFWLADTKTPLAAHAKALDRIVFHEKLGTVRDKVERLKALYGKMGKRLPPVPADKMETTLELMKADLATQMVFEFTSLEGVVGMLYARHEGLDEEIIRAIYEHKLPKSAGGAMPDGTLGAVAGVLDRIDTLAGYMGVGVRLSGSSDPFGLRRNGLTLLSLLDSGDFDVDLEELAAAAAEGYGGIIKDMEKTLKDTQALLKDRLVILAREKGFAHDYVAAVLDAHGRRPRRFFQCLEVLSGADVQVVQDVAEQAKRIARILKNPAGSVREELLEEVERELFALAAGPAVEARVLAEKGEYGGALAMMHSWTPVVAVYFEKVMVNHEDPAIRGNRHALVKIVLDAFSALADFTKIEKK